MSDSKKLMGLILKLTKAGAALTEGTIQLSERQKVLEHVVALQYYNSLHPGTERGRIGTLLSAGHRLRLVPKGTAELVVEAQE